MKGICYILGAGDIANDKVSLNGDDLLLCADGGLAAAGLFSREPDLVVGDFDSYGKIPSGENVRVYPREKDDTDMLIAIKEGIARGYKVFVIYGALGGDRPEHSVANIQSLAYICSKGGTGFIIHGRSCFMAFRNSRVEFSDRCRGYISLFSLKEESRGITLENFRYTLTDGTLLSDCPMGVSNEFTDKRGSAEVRDGTLLAVWQGRPKDIILRDNLK